MRVAPVHGTRDFATPSVSQFNKCNSSVNSLISLLFSNALYYFVSFRMFLNHPRYDAKADLWSVGTVLFEMIAGRPPFNGENHIDLLRNIQRKAVRLPPDVRVSKACVNLLRILLNRNPLSRAGFKEFFEACEAFVALGCGGCATSDGAGGVGCTTTMEGASVGGTNRIATKDLGTIHENDHCGTNAGSTDNLMEVATTAEHERQTSTETTTTAAAAVSTNPAKIQQQQQRRLIQPSPAKIVSPNLLPSSTPTSAVLIPNSINLGSNTNPGISPRPQTLYQQPAIRNRLEPLTSSPPTGSGIFFQPFTHSGIPPPLSSPSTTQHAYQHQIPYPQQHITGYHATSATGIVHANSISQSQVSANDDSGFVMVEYTKSPTSSQHYYATGSQQQSYRGSNNEIVEQRARASKGMLSTSPGTGKMLLGMVGRATMGFGVGVGSSSNSNTSPLAQSPLNVRHEQLEQTSRMAKVSDDITAAIKMIATAEDVGRRAVSVAHLGDNRAYQGMRLLFKTNEEGSSLHSSTAMEGVEEEPATCGSTSGNSSDNIHDFSTDNSGSTEIMGATRRRSSTISSADKNFMGEASVEDEMPFAISPDAPSVSLPSRSNPSVYNRGSSISSMKKSSTMKASPHSIRARFNEALSCYLKSLKMLKGAVGAAQRVTNELKDIEVRLERQSAMNCPNNDVGSELHKLKHRCEITSNWLCSQFRGVLERADAANLEIAKLAIPNNSSSTTSANAGTKEGTSVEELIYNHALASGRDAAVKQLLGQYEAARSCYRSAGLLAETLLMEVNIGPDDRKILEGYVDGFASRITELDQLMLQQSRMTISSSNTPPVMSQLQHSSRGSGIVGLIGPPPVPAGIGSTPFVVGSPR